MVIGQVEAAKARKPGKEIRLGDYRARSHLVNINTANKYNILMNIFMSTEAKCSLNIFS